MSEASVIGLGAMGSALARALVRSGRRITVWNRTMEKASSLVSDGAVLATSAALAVAAGPVVIVCVDNYDVTRTILGADEVAAGLSGRVLVQLSTGSPEEARDSEAWARERGVQYLDGAILAFPNQIATPDATILVSGAESAFRRSEPLLKLFAENLSFLGEKVGSASALDCAVLSFFVGGLLGAVHGARICEAEGLRVDEFGSLLADIAPVLGGDVKHLGETIQVGKYENPQAALKTWAAALGRILQQAREAQINSEFPTFASALFRKGITAGFEMEEVASLIKVLRADA
ncbi:MAG: NAD(P)-dependent oxidoreductase [Pyrinomonadaceae bacterium]